MGLENAGLENDGQNFNQLWAKLRGLENAGVQDPAIPCEVVRHFPVLHFQVVHFQSPLRGHRSAPDDPTIA